MSNIYSTSKVSHEVSILDTSNDLPLQSGVTSASATQRENPDVFEDKVSQVMYSSSLTNNMSEKQPILKNIQPLAYGHPDQLVDSFDGLASEIPKRNELMMETEKYSQDCHRISLSKLLNQDEHDILKQFKFDGSSPSMSELSLDKQTRISESIWQRKPRQSYRTKDSEKKANGSCHRGVDFKSVSEDDLPLYLRFSKTISTISQEIGSKFEEDSQNVSTVFRKRQRASNIRALETSSASPQAGPVTPFIKRKSPEHQEGLNKEHLIVPQPCMLPHNMACLFVEVCGDDYMDDVRATALRHLLVRWSGAIETEVLSGISKAPGVESSTSLLPPPHRRIIVLMTDNTSVLEKSLLWWTLRPYAEHALILPIFGICPIGDNDESSASVTTSKTTFNIRDTHEGKRTSKDISKDELSTKAIRTVKHNSSKRQLHMRLTLLQAVALQHLCNSFAVNTSNSYALCYSKTYWNALKALGIPTHHMKHTLEECVRCIDRVCAGATKTLKKVKTAPLI
ncbi:unnamed protein product [Phytomonas sp. Hart1]|nr:unnamed protein product [Phytomonas sp. Hart1]|eukprot:CCW68399.1 unnamed protein product [Phytomonas sp. isolate Hart1]